MVKKVLILGFVSALIFSSCNNDKKAENSDVAKSSENETEINIIGDQKLDSMPEYSKAAPGTAERIERAFENAPPMIPHMTEGFFPITKDNNICLSCHMPDKVAASGAIPIPPTHFTNYRPNLVKEGDIYKVDAKEGEVFSMKLVDLSAARYNCSQCHVPQANVTVDIKNNFERVFRNENSKNKSNLNENIDEGVK